MPAFAKPMRRSDPSGDMSSATDRMSVTSSRSISGRPLGRIRDRMIPAPVSIDMPAGSPAFSRAARRVVQRVALPQRSASEPSELRYRRRTSAFVDGSRKTIPSAPTPVPRAQTSWMTLGSWSRPGASRRASTITKSLPDPLILTNSRLVMPSDPSEHRHQAQARDHPDRLANDVARHLARALCAIDEDDRDFDDLEAFLPNAKAPLDLKRVTV